MDCPQCGARVPADDAFCGKCGYAMRDQAPDRLDQSRIRVHEEPEPSQQPPDRATSQRRIRKHTVLGMPSAKPASADPKPSATPVAPVPASPTSMTSTRQSRASQKTMLGIPRPEFPQPPGSPMPPDREAARDEPATDEDSTVEPAAVQSHRPRARVRYDSADEPFPVVQRRRKALWTLAVLVLLAAAWLGYRFFTVHG